MSVLLSALSGVIESEKVASAINGFSMAAILSSFIGVGLGVFDYLADLFKFDNSRTGRCKTWAVTFLPPLLLSCSSRSASCWLSVMPVPPPPSGPASSRHCWCCAPGRGPSGAK